MSQAPVCPHCGKPAALTTGAVIYPHRPDLAQKPIWQCASCSAYCGCHPGTTKSLGTPANKELRTLRMAVHAALDPKWKHSTNPRMRSIVYQALAVKMKIATTECHVGMFDEAQCRTALECLATMNA